MRWVHRIFLAGGVALLLWVFLKLGPGEVLHHLSLIGWGWILLIGLEGFGEFLHTMAWRRCMSGRCRELSWLKVGMIRQAGMSFNYLTPTAHMGGEVVKGMLLGALGDGVGATASVIVGKLALALAQLLFVSIGSFATLWMVSLPWGFVAIWVLSTACFSGGIGGFLWLQKRGKLGGVARALERRGFGGRFVASAARWLTEVDRDLEEFHKERPGDLYRAILWHMVGFSMGILQVALFLRWVVGWESLGRAAIIWFLGAWFDLVGFMVPAGVGVQEGSRALLFDLMGLKGTTGLAFGLVLRVTKGFWAMVGLVCYGLLARGGNWGRVG